jgi:hypothetical protein
MIHGEKNLKSDADALMISGFNRTYLSLLASGKAIDDKLGHHHDRDAELEDDADVRSRFRPAAQAGAGHRAGAHAEYAPCHEPGDAIAARRPAAAAANAGFRA